MVPNPSKLNNEGLVSVSSKARIRARFPAAYDPKQNVLTLHAQSLTWRGAQEPCISPQIEPKNPFMGMYLCILRMDFHCTKRTLIHCKKHAGSAELREWRSIWTSNHLSTSQWLQVWGSGASLQTFGGVLLQRGRQQSFETAG